MITYTLQNSLPNTLLGMEPYQYGIRLVILKDGRVIACRKEPISRMVSFTKTDNITIFKGRLQMQTTANTIVIYVKEQLMGFINKMEMINDLEMLNAGG